LNICKVGETVSAEATVFTLSAQPLTETAESSMNDK